MSLEVIIKVIFRNCFWARCPDITRLIHFRVDVNINFISIKCCLEPKRKQETSWKRTKNDTNLTKFLLILNFCCRFLYKTKRPTAIIIKVAIRNKINERLSPSVLNTKKMKEMRCRKGTIQTWTFFCLQVTTTRFIRSFHDTRQARFAPSASWWFFKT